MTDILIHHRDYASVLLDDDLDWPRVHELVQAIETAVEYYRYGLIEFRVRSLGGSNEALEYLLERFWGVARARMPLSNPRTGAHVERRGTPRRSRRREGGRSRRQAALPRRFPVPPGRRERAGVRRTQRQALQGQ